MPLADVLDPSAPICRSNRCKQLLGRPFGDLVNGPNECEKGVIVRNVREYGKVSQIAACARVECGGSNHTKIASGAGIVFFALVWVAHPYPAKVARRKFPLNIRLAQSIFSDRHRGLRMWLLT